MAFSDLIDDVDRAVLTHVGGVDVIYTTEAGAPTTVQGIFDENYILSDPGHAGVEQLTPMVWLQLEDLPTDPRLENPTVTINSNVYTVRDRPTDGVGGSIRLSLRRVSP